MAPARPFVVAGVLAAKMIACLYCWAFGEPLGTAGEESHGETCTFDPVTLEHPGAFGPFAQPHQLFVASTVPFPRFAIPTPLPLRLF